MQVYDPWAKNNCKSTPLQISVSLMLWDKITIFIILHDMVDPIVIVAFWIFLSMFIDFAQDYDSINVISVRFLKFSDDVIQIWSWLLNILIFHVSISKLNIIHGVLINFFGSLSFYVGHFNFLNFI